MQPFFQTFTCKGKAINVMIHIKYVCSNGISKH